MTPADNHRLDPNHSDPSLRPDIAVIPLALSERGIQAISGAGVPGLLDDILADSRDIYTRMIHTFDNKGNSKLIPMTYGHNGEVRDPRTTISTFDVANGSV